MKIVYRLLLRLYPRSVRQVFGDEMQSVFLDCLEEKRAQGALATARFVLIEFASVLAGALLARKSQDDAWLAFSTGTPRGVPQEVFEAENRTAANLARMTSAISSRQFERARFYSNEERRSRRELQDLRERYGIEE